MLYFGVGLLFKEAISVKRVGIPTFLENSYKPSMVLIIRSFTVKENYISSAVGQILSTKQSLLLYQLRFDSKVVIQIYREYLTNLKQILGLGIIVFVLSFI